MAAVTVNKPWGLAAINVGNNILFVFKNSTNTYAYLYIVTLSPTSTKMSVLFGICR
jgi:hypothetical protein